MKKNNKKKNNKKKIMPVVLVTLAVSLALYIGIGFLQTNLEVTEYTYHNEKIPEAFDNYKIVLISDLHHKNFGKNQSELIKKIKEAKPELILMTGDIVDEDHTDMTSTEDFLKGISDIAPAYYVTGNHELTKEAQSQYAQLEVLFEKYGICDLDDSSVEIKKGEDSIYLHGQKFRSKYVTKFLKHADEEKFNILMYHCSDYFGLISDYGYDIIMSGHTHGGIVRLPFVGGLVGNTGEFFPKYDGGVFNENNCTMFSSRGLGDAKIPRFYNPPEIVVITLKCN